jgi:hypothetical protein
MKTIISEKPILFTFIVMVLVSVILAQPPGIEWSRTYGGNSSDIANSVYSTSSGAYIFAGYTKSFNADSNDVYLVKTDSAGNILWYRLYGGADYDDARCLQETADGGYILAGRTRSFGAGGNDMYVVRTDSNGDSLWTRTYGGSNSDAAECIIQTADGGYLIAGDTRPYSGAHVEMYLVKTDSLGDTIWTRTYGGSDDRVAYSVQQTDDGGYIVVGCNPIYGGLEYDIYLVKTDSRGDTLWTRTYGGENEDYAISVEQTGDGDYMIAGSTRSFGAGEGDFYVLRTDSLGDILWTRTYGSGNNDYATSMQQTIDGRYIILGGMGTYGGETDLYLIKIENVGDTIWTIVYGGENIEVGSSVDVTAEGNYIVAGYIWDWEMPADCWLVKTGLDTAVSGAPSIQWVSHPKDFILHPVYPNPFNPVTIISYEVPVRGLVRVDVYNVLGQKTAELVHDIASGGRHSVIWDGGELPSGVYFVRLEAGEFNHTRKVVLLK